VASPSNNFDVVSEAKEVVTVIMSVEAAAVPVNGKVSLGTRRLVVSHVENAASFFAYQEAQAGYMKEIAEACRDQCSAGLTPLNHPPTLHQVSLAAVLRIPGCLSRIRLFSIPDPKFSQKMVSNLCEI
jgi:hypothetical protein